MNGIDQDVWTRIVIAVKVALLDARQGTHAHLRHFVGTENRTSEDFVFDELFVKPFGSKQSRIVDLSMEKFHYKMITT